MKAVYFQGSLYFIADDDDQRVLDLVSFDPSSEVFSYISLPAHFYEYQSEYKGFRIALIDGGCTLAVFDFDSCMWVLESSNGEGGPMRWTKRYKFHLAIIDVLHIKKNSDILMQWCGQDVSLVLPNRHQKVRQRWDLVMSYNLETEEQKILLQNKHHVLKVHNVRGYVERLILHK